MIIWIDRSKCDKLLYFNLNSIILRLTFRYIYNQKPKYPAIFLIDLFFFYFYLEDYFIVVVVVSYLDYVLMLLIKGFTLCGSGLFLGGLFLIFSDGFNMCVYLLDYLTVYCYCV